MKFKTAEQLEKAYAELQKSFTQKCQQLAELKKQRSANETTEVSTPVIGEAEGAVVLTPASSGAAAPRTITGNGGNFYILPPLKPKTLTEANTLAKEMLK